MRKFGKPLRLVLCVSVLAIALGVPSSSPTQAAGPPSGLDVTVTNTPLPVQGTVNVGNLPSTQSISGSVSITGTPNVSVVNPPSSPVPIRDVDNAPREPFETGINLAIACGDIVADLSFPVPQGKRLVIQHVALQSGQRVPLSGGNFVKRAEIKTNFGGDLVEHPLNLVPQASGASPTAFVADHPLLAYGDPNTQVEIEVELASPLCSGSGFSQVLAGAVAGYVVDAP